MKRLMTFKNLALVGVSLVIFACGTDSETQAPAEQTGAQSQQVSIELQEASPAAEVTDAELKQFAQTMEKLEPLNQEANEEVVVAIQGSGLSMERFQEIAQSPQTGVDPQVSEAEQQQMMEINAKLQGIQQKIQAKQLEIIEQSDITVERFQQISLAIQQDPQLQQRFIQILDQPQTEAAE